MGVVQNKSSFLNAVLLSLDNKINEQRINNSNEFKRYIVSHLENKPDDFKKLNDGNIALKYKELSEYTKMLLDTSIYWTDIVDIIQRLAHVNVMVLDIPYKFSESTKIADYENIKLICNPNVKLNKKNPFIILMKRVNTFEVIVLMKGDGESNKIKTTFQYTGKESKRGELGLVDFFLDYHTDSCVRENVFPESFPYVEMFTVQELIKILSDTKQSIIAQVVNVFNKTEFVLTRKGILIPTKESGIVSKIPVISTSDLEAANKLLTIDLYKTGVKQLNNIFKEKSISKRVSLLGVTLEGSRVTSVLTSFGQLVPVKNTEFVPDYQSFGNNELKVLDFKYYPDVNKALSRQSEGNDQEKYSAYIQGMKTTLYKIKTRLAKAISESDTTKDNIMTIIKDTKLPMFQKIEDIVRIFDTILDTYTPDDSQSFGNVLDFLLRNIANEVINDNVENLLLNNLVVSDVFNPNEVIKRDKESVLLSIDEIKKWIKTYKREM
jgi:hypothetical protein